MSAQHRLARLLAPHSIALVGASPRLGGVGRGMVETLVAGGFSGDLHLINPRYPQIDGRACLATLADLDEAPDLVIAGVGAANIEAVFDQAIEVGAGGLVVFDACHGENQKGIPLTVRLRDKAAEADLPVCGGNGMGFYNLSARCHASFYSLPQMRPGGITLIAHSGSVFTVLALNDQRYRFNLVVSPGQEIGAYLDEYVEYALAQSETAPGSLRLFMEAARRPEAFATALAKAAAPGRAGGGLQGRTHRRERPPGRDPQRRLGRARRRLRRTAGAARGAAC